jgi:hypothetical protein
LDSVSRARQFLAKKASKLALSVVPLAALALVPSARASATFDVGTCTVDLAFASGSCSTSQYSATGGNPNLNWIQMTGKGSVNVVNSSAGFIDFLASGGGSGSIVAGVVPVSWDFQVNAMSTVNWTISFEIFANNGSGSYTQSGYLSSGGEVKGASEINVPSGGVTGWKMSLNTNAVNPYVVTIPSGSTLDLNSPAPEPSTILLTSLGGVALLLRRRKKKV